MPSIRQKQNQITPMLLRVPAAEVEAFLEAGAKQVTVQKRSGVALDGRLAELERARKAAIDLLQELDKKIETEAEEIATRTARKIREKTEADAAVKALAQASAIAADYRKLEGWMTEFVMAGVAAIFDTMQPGEAWSRAILRALQSTADRWQLTLLCHPADFSEISEAVAGAGLSDAIKAVMRDPTVGRGRCYLQGNNDQVEIDIGAQLEALKPALRGALAPKTVEVQ